MEKKKLRNFVVQGEEGGTLVYYMEGAQRKAITDQFYWEGRSLGEGVLNQ